MTAATGSVSETTMIASSLYQLRLSFSFSKTECQSNHGIGNRDELLDGVGGECVGDVLPVPILYGVGLGHLARVGEPGSVELGIRLQLPPELLSRRCRSQTPLEETQKTA